MSDRDFTKCHWIKEDPNKQVFLFNCELNTPFYDAAQDRKMVNNGFAFCPFCGKPIKTIVSSITDLTA